MAIARVALPVAAAAPFDYWIPDGLAVTRGALVEVRLARRALAGVVVDVVATSEVPQERLQPIVELRQDVPPLPADVLGVAEFVGEVLPGTDGARSGADAAAARGGTRELDFRVKASTAAQWAGAQERAGVALNVDQARAAKAIIEAAGSFAPLSAARRHRQRQDRGLPCRRAECIAAGGQVLILVPEINLTPQFRQRIAEALPAEEDGDAAQPAPGRRAPAQLVRRRQREKRDLVLGTRLAVFTPLPRLGLIVVDEEHDPSFKQQDGVRYHGRDVAVWRARQRNVPVVLGSATPSLETLVHAQRGPIWLARNCRGAR